MKFLIIFVVVVIVLIIWQRRSAKKAKVDYLSKERKQKESHDVEVRKELREDNRIFEQGEARKQQRLAEETGHKNRIERDSREAALRLKIKERKDREAEENTQKGEK